MALIIRLVAKRKLGLGRLDLFDSMVAGILALDDPIPTPHQEWYQEETKTKHILQIVFKPILSLCKSTP